MRDMEADTAAGGAGKTGTGEAKTGRRGADPPAEDRRRMEENEKEILIRETERNVRREIAERMREDHMAPQMIEKYTGIRPEETERHDMPYEETAKQVACEMLLRGLPLELISTATGVPPAVLRELKSQLPE